MAHSLYNPMEIIEKKHYSYAHMFKFMSLVLKWQWIAATEVWIELSSSSWPITVAHAQKIYESLSNHIKLYQIIFSLSFSDENGFNSRYIACKASVSCIRHSTIRTIIVQWHERRDNLVNDVLLLNAWNDSKLRILFDRNLKNAWARRGCAKLISRRLCWTQFDKFFLLGFFYPIPFGSCIRKIRCAHGFCCSSFILAALLQLFWFCRNLFLAHRRFFLTWRLHIVDN